MPLLDEDDDQQELATGHDESKDTEGKSQVFLPSVFEQAAEYANEESTSIPSSETSISKREEKLPDIEYDVTDVGDMISVPFDLARILSKYKGFELTPQEAERLGKKWLRPFQRHLGSVKGMDIYLAVCSSLTIITDKTLGYIEWKEQQKKNGSS